MSQLTFLSLGANVGDALETLHAAVHALDDVDGFAVEEASAVYETAPWPPPDDPRHVPQDPFLNVVVRGRATLPPHELLDEVLLLERAFGRDRTREVRWGPRTLDIDLLLVGEATVDDDRLQLPHPRLDQRAFVLVPLSEVWPGGTLPDGRRVTQLLNALAPIEDVELVVRLDEVPTRHLARPGGPDGGGASFARPGGEAIDDDGAAPR